MYVKVLYSNSKHLNYFPINNIAGGVASGIEIRPNEWILNLFLKIKF
jgi:hypothetical protein